MRFSTKIVVLLVAAAALPVAASGLISSTLSSKAVTGETLKLQGELTRQLAAQVDGWAKGLLHDLERGRSYLPLERLEGAELTALLRVLYRQLADATTVALVDAEGRPVVTPAYLPAATAAKSQALPDDLRQRVRLRQVDAPALARRLPAELPGCGAAYASKGGMRLACGVALTKGDRRLVAEVTLAPLRRLLATASRVGGRLVLADNAARVIVASAELPGGEQLGYLARVGQTGASYTDERGREVLGTAARVARLDGWLRLEQPLAHALGPARRLLRYTVLWTALCLALALAGGVFLGRGVTVPVGRLARAARAMQEGDLDQRVPDKGRDELGQLAGAFNEMAAEVQRSVAVIKAQRDELRGWNEELQQRVEERTREVEEALEQVIRSQKMGALGELSAGVAHELNNPLAGIMLASQLAQAQLGDTPDARETLETIVEQSQRMHEIVQGLLRFAETPEKVDHRPLTLAGVCESALDLARSALEEGKVEATLDLPDGLARVSGDAGELQQALLHLIYNAVRAMPDGGKLSIEGREVKEAVRLTVRDTGHGIAADKLDRIFEPFFAEQKPRTRGAGLGLSVVDRIVREHEGRITVRSQLGEGTAFNIYLPGLRKELHL